MRWQKKNQKERMERRVARLAARVGRPPGLTAKGDVTPCRLCGDPLYALDPDVQPIHAACRRRARLEHFRAALRRPPTPRSMRRRHAKTKEPANAE